MRVHEGAFLLERQYCAYSLRFPNFYSSFKVKAGDTSFFNMNLTF